MPTLVATWPQSTLPIAMPPMNTTTNAASPRARTHAGSVICAETCSAERIEIQAAPVATMATASNGTYGRYASASAANA